MSKVLDGPQLNAQRRRVIGRLLLRASRVFQENAIERIHALGYSDYRAGDNAVLIHLEMRGNRISDLAQRAGVTKQAISQLVRDLERRGVVRKERDPEDGRAQIVKLTPDGETMMRDAFRVVLELDEELEELLPAGRLEAIREDLTILLQHLDPKGF